MSGGGRQQRERVVAHDPADLLVADAFDRGDLIVLGGNPLEDIHNIRKVEAVITNGVLYNTAELWRSVGFQP